MNLKNKITLCWRILTFKPGKLYQHALKELPKSSDEMQAAMNQSLLELVMVFSTQGHSGFSAGYATAALTTLLDFKPLGALTGADDEWSEVSEGLWQNIRCSRVFKDATGRAYNIEGRVFRDRICSYTNKDSWVDVTFPYTPKTEYVAVDEKEKSE